MAGCGNNRGRGVRGRRGIRGRRDDGLGVQVVIRMEGRMKIWCRLWGHKRTQGWPFTDCERCGVQI